MLKIPNPTVPISINTGIGKNEKQYDNVTFVMDTRKNKFSKQKYSHHFIIISYINTLYYYQK